MNSLTEFTGSLLLTTMAVAYSAVPAIGTTSRNASKDGFASMA
jgi:hypothetical protein